MDYLYCFECYQVADLNLHLPPLQVTPGSKAPADAELIMRNKDHSLICTTQ